jgi:hypothetical protein
LPIIVDASWQYADGPLVQLHSAWDPNGGAFRHGFRLVAEKATLVYDMAAAPDMLQVLRDGKASEMPIDPPAAHQAELDDFARCVGAGEQFARFTPADSRRAVELGLQELELMRG